MTISSRAVKFPSKADVNKAVYSKYRVVLKDAAIAIPAPFTNACYGIAGHLMSESEYLALRGVKSAMPTEVGVPP